MIPSHIDSNPGTVSRRHSPGNKDELLHSIREQHDTPRPTHDLLYQTRPIHSKPSQFRAKGWTDTILGYKREARQLTLCLLRNRKLAKRPYQWFVTINIEVEMDAKQTTAIWTNTCRNLRRKGIVAFWIREPTRSNKVHYHLIVSSPTSRTALARAIKEAMPPRNVVGWHKSIRRINDEYMLCHYVTKAEIAGFDRRTGRPIKDRFAKKRLLFRPNLKLRKHGTIGDFWVKPARLIWQDFQNTEKRIAKGLDDHRVRKIVEHVYELVGDLVPLQHIKRSYGYFADEQNIERWLGTIR
jgi:hypothetical protein